MILSMTGYGAAEHVEGQVTYTAEVRTLNSRYLKISMKLPEYLAAAEPMVDKLLRTRIARGSVAFSLRIRDASAPGGICLNEAVLRGYVDQLVKAVGDPSIATRLNIVNLVNLPGVCETPILDESARQRQVAIVEEVTGQALEALLRMRQTEGGVLRQDLLGSCEVIRAEAEAIAARAPRVIEEYHERLRNRVATLLKESNLQLEQDTLAREVAIFAERSDISEELARLGSHLDQFCALLDGDNQVGRRLDFLTQELLREANTIASKSNDAVLTRRILEVKVQVDRLREQVQNVE
jgi:uncharacterized protein (TIGR00255 family)